MVDIEELNELEKLQSFLSKNSETTVQKFVEFIEERAKNEFSDSTASNKKSEQIKSEQIKNYFNKLKEELGLNGDASKSNDNKEKNHNKEKFENIVCLYLIGKRYNQLKERNTNGNLKRNDIETVSLSELLKFDKKVSLQLEINNLAMRILGKKNKDEENQNEKNLNVTDGNHLNEIKGALLGEISKNTAQAEKVLNKTFTNLKKNLDKLMLAENESITNLKKNLDKLMLAENESMLTDSNRDSLKNIFSNAEPFIERNLEKTPSVKHQLIDIKHPTLEKSLSKEQEAKAKQEYQNVLQEFNDKFKSNADTNSNPDPDPNSNSNSDSIIEKMTIRTTTYEGSSLGLYGCVHDALKELKELKEENKNSFEIYSNENGPEDKDLNKNICSGEIQLKDNQKEIKLDVKDSENTYEKSVSITYGEGVQGTKISDFDNAAQGAIDGFKANIPNQSLTAEYQLQEGFNFDQLESKLFKEIQEQLTKADKNTPCAVKEVIFKSGDNTKKFAFDGTNLTEINPKASTQAGRQRADSQGSQGSQVNLETTQTHKPTTTQTQQPKHNNPNTTKPT